MNPLFDVVQDSAGNVLAGKVLSVKVRATGDPAVIYSDEGGTSVIPGGVVTADSFGRIEFWSAGGTYSIYEGASKVGDVFLPSISTTSVATSHAVLVTQAAAGAIPGGVTRVSSGCWSTPGDDGGDNYSRVSSATLNAYGLSSATKALVAFQDQSGDWWLLDNRSPRLASVGCIGQALGSSPILTAEYDSAPAITALSEFLFKVYGGGVMSYGMRNYYLHTKPTFQRGVGISGPPVLAREARPLDELETVADVDWLPGLVLGTGVQIEVLDNFTSASLCLKRAGILVHHDLAGALDEQVSFAGTGLTKKTGASGRNVTIGQFVAYGFAFGIDGDRLHGIRVGEAYGDCATLAMVRDCGETGVIGEAGLCKRKPATTNNNAIILRSVAVTAMFNSGGYVGLTLAEDVAAMGFTTHQRCGNNSLPPAIVNKRHTVTVLSPTSVRLEGAAWDAGYASFALDGRSKIAFQPGCSSSVASFYNAGGKVGVRSTLPFPFRVGHLALLGANDLAASGMAPVLTVVSDTDFVLEEAWDPALLTTNLAGCEFGAMPNARYHPNVVPYWGSNQGFGAASVNSDGIRINFANKGGSGFYCDSSSAHIHGANEGPQPGENDYGPTDTIGLLITKTRDRFTGDFKSCGTGVKIALQAPTDHVYGYGIQSTDAGRCSLDLSIGSATLESFYTKGLGRIKLSNISGLDILEGNVQPSNLAGNAVGDILKTGLRWRVDTTVHQAAATWAWWAYNAAGEAVNVCNMSSSGVSFPVPISAPRRGLTSTGATPPGGAASVTAADNNCDIILTTNTAAIAFDATTVSDRFRFTVRNYRPGGDWTIPATAGYWGAGVVLRYSRGAVHTKLLDKGEATFTVEDITVSGITTRYLTVRGDTA